MKTTLSLFAVIFTFTLHAQKNYPWTNQIDPANVTIVRDTFGVPHIYGKTDADAGYGLAWANSEDAFQIVQEVILSSKGMMGMYKGKEGAAFDFVLNSIGAKRIVEEKYDTEISESYKKYLEGYCQGLNAYAEAHPEEVFVKSAFPVTPKDILQGMILSLTGLSYSHREIQNIMDGKYNSSSVFPEEPVGSNAFALNSTRTVDGKTYLCINPHFHVEGRLAFYEAHLNSEEGLNIHGATFHGVPSLFMATNQYLGWGMTYDNWDLTDVFQLKMKSKNSKKYEFDGQWEKLESRPFWVKVKLGGIKLPVRLKTYWSKYGATYKTKNKQYFSVRFGANMTISCGQQLYQMNRCTNLEEFKNALRIQGLSRFNIVYADRYDHIFYVDNGTVPIRDTSFNWSGILPGNTSKNLWTKFHPIDSLPQVQDPECGYVFTTNHTPFHSSCDTACPTLENKLRYPDNMGYIITDNNRSNRFAELISEKERFSFDDLKRIKYDKTLPKTSEFMRSAEWIFKINHYTHQRIVDVINAVQLWDRNADTSSVGAALFKKTLEVIFKKKGYGYENFFTGMELTEGFVDTCMWEAKLFFLENYGQLEVPLGQTQFLVRGDKAVTLQGFPDVLSATYTEPYKNGREKAMITDTYTQFVVFGPNGPEKLETLVPFGSSSKPGTEHYTSQMERFSKQLPKQMTLDKDTIMKQAVKIYHPQ